MEYKALELIIKNYERNKKRMREIERDYYSIGSTSILSLSTGSKESHDKNADKIEKLLKNEEYKRLQNLVDAVDRTKLKLNTRQSLILNEYIINGRSARWFWQKGYSESTVYRSRKEILNILKDELDV